MRKTQNALVVVVKMGGPTQQSPPLSLFVIFRRHSATPPASKSFKISIKPTIIIQTRLTELLPGLTWNVLISRNK